MDQLPLKVNFGTLTTTTRLRWPERTSITLSINVCSFGNINEGIVVVLFLDHIQHGKFGAVTYIHHRLFFPVKKLGGKNRDIK